MALNVTFPGFELLIITDVYFSFADDAFGRHKATREPDEYAPSSAPSRRGSKII
jgi:hypothetical protein